MDLNNPLNTLNKYLSSWIVASVHSSRVLITNFVLGAEVVLEQNVRGSAAVLSCQCWLISPFTIGMREVQHWLLSVE
jgi:hypothetical protein